MKIGEAIDNVYIALNNMRIGTDSAVYRADIQSYLQVACNATFNQAYADIRAQMLSEGVIEKAIEGNFVKSYTLPIKTDADNRQYLELMPMPMPIWNNKGLVYVGTRNDQFVEIQEAYLGMQKFLKSFKRDVVSYIQENDLIYFENLPIAVKSIFVRLVPNVFDLTLDDELPIPAGYESQVLERCINWFAGAVQNPKDNTNNKKSNQNQQSAEK